MKDTLSFLENVIQRFDTLSAEEVKRLFVQVAREYAVSALIIDNLRDGVIALDRENRVLAANKQAAFLLGVGADDRGKDIKGVSLPDFRDALMEALAANENVRRTIRVEREAVPRIIDLEVLSLGQSGVIKGSLIIASDITEAAGKDQEMKRMEYLASLTTLAAGVAHEIKNPLGSLDIHIQLIERLLKRQDQSSKDVKDMRGFISIVKEEISRLEDIVNSFLFSVRKINLDLKPVRAGDLIAETVGFLKYEIERAKIKVDVRLDEGVPVLEADQRYIKQALINVIQNSVDALADSRTRRIDIRVSYDEMHNAVQIRMRDTGAGIAKKDMGKLFEPYFTTKTSGTGLGLTNVYRIIKAHGGEVTVASDEGKYTEVTVSLPVTVAERKLLEDTHLKTQKTEV
ncbi:MAG: ATP-binding protein [Spirochaetota bacterium]